MKESTRIAKVILLTPLSKIYGMVTFMRNKFFDWNILKSESFNIPVICVGNIAVGGTGKTPHTEYIIRMLMQDYNIGVISRGYKRMTSGFVMASSTSTPSDIGDEPFQIQQKFGNKIRVAVCEKRVIGIKKLLKNDPSINLILLDDAFQHRYVKPDISIVLTEYSRPVFEDKLLPLGRLRESKQAILSRADMVIVTKCPEDIKPMDFRLFKKKLELFPFQKLFFSRIKYDSLAPVFPENATYIPMLEILNEDDIILTVTGIANPRPLIKYLKKFKPQVKAMHFQDHHNFTRADIKDIEDTYRNLNSKRFKIILTTEKDAVRLATNPYVSFELRRHIFYQPINIEFLPYESETFYGALIKSIAEIKHK